MFPLATGKGRENHYEQDEQILLIRLAMIPVPS
jgi:hypothetical protein